MYFDWTVYVEDNDNNRGQKYPFERGQRLIQVQLIYSLPIVTTIKKNTTTTTTKIPDPFLNAVCPQGIPRNDNNRAQKYSPKGEQVFYPGSINLLITICDSAMKK